VEAHHQIGGSVTTYQVGEIQSIHDPTIDYDIDIKRPLTALLMADKFRGAVHHGEKTITIRVDCRDYQVGDKVLLCSNYLDWVRSAKITYVRHCYLKNVPIEDLKDDDMTDLNDATTKLKEYYPNITVDSVVTVIRWQLI
jgi:hypothetical protein